MTHPDDDPELGQLHRLDTLAAIQHRRRESAPAEVRRLNQPGAEEDRLLARRLVHEQEWSATIDRALAHARLEDFNGVPGGDLLAEWAAGAWRTGTNLVVLGAIGVGKSHAMVAVTREVIAAATSCRYWAAVDLMDALHWDSPGHKEAMWKAQRVGVLAVDDVGTEGCNDWTQRMWFQLIHRRWSDKRPTIVTTNLEPSELEDQLGARTYSRLAGGSIAVRLVGHDRRRA